MYIQVATVSGCNTNLVLLPFPYYVNERRLLLLIIIKHARAVIVPRVNSIRTTKYGGDTSARDGSH